MSGSCRYYVQHNEVMPKVKVNNLPVINLSNTKLKYADSSAYPGQIISKNFMDDDDVRKETKKLCTTIRTSRFVNEDVKCNLLKTFCYPLYSSPLWGRHRVSTFNRLRVTQYHGTLVWCPSIEECIKTVKPVSHNVTAL